jgi:hypothetical protein
MQLKDVTTTTFGLVIAYLVPGMTGLYALTYWSSQADGVFAKFGTTEANFGLFLLVMMAGLAAGMLLTPLKSLFYEEFVCRSARLDSRHLATLADSGKHDAMRVAIDEQYRYHQCWGNMSLALLPLVAGWFHREWDSLSVLGGTVSVVVALLAEGGAVWAALEAYKRYVVRATAILS